PVLAGVRDPLVADPRLDRDRLPDLRLLRLPQQQVAPERQLTSPRPTPPAPAAVFQNHPALPRPAFQDFQPMLKQLLARKTDFSNDDSAHGPGLRRTLGPWGITALGIGAVIGTGIFVVTGTAEHAGPAVLISFVIAAICSGFSALCYAEFATLIPISGSSYSYAYASL